MHTITYIEGEDKHIFYTKQGTNLLSALKKENLTVYGTASSRINCGGRGLCATCGVYVLSPTIPPLHWHDKLAYNFGYPRLTCKITINTDLIIEKPKNKIIWGQLWPKIKKK